MANETKVNCRGPATGDPKSEPDESSYMLRDKRPSPSIRRDRQYQHITRQERQHRIFDDSWAWYVVGGCAFANFLLPGMLRSFGPDVLDGFVQVHELEFPNRSVFSCRWIPATFNLTFFIAGSLSCLMCKLISHRAVTFCGGLLASTGMMFCSFANSISHLYIRVFITLITISLAATAVGSHYSVTVSQYIEYLVSYDMGRAFLTFVVVSMAAIAVTFGDRLQCKDPNGQPIDWFTAIKLPNLYSSLSNGTAYVYMDAKTPEWIYLTGITTEKSAIGHTVAQMYANTKTYNESIMWVVYNDAPTNGPTTFLKGHSKGMVVATNSSGLWLVHSVPKFPKLPYQNKNSYAYPKTGVRFGQSFLCMSMTADELDKVGDQLINNEVLVYSSHFGGDLKSTYPGLYNASLPQPIPGVKNDAVRLQPLKSIEGFEFLSISKNRHFEKDLYEDLITHMAQSNVYTETWLNSRDRFNSSCSGKYKTMNIKSLAMKNINGLKNVLYNSTKDHSKWVVTGKSSVHWTCIGDINRAKEQTKRGGGTVCIKSLSIWNQYKQLVSNIEKCKI